MIKKKNLSEMAKRNTAYIKFEESDEQDYFKVTLVLKHYTILTKKIKKLRKRSTVNYSFLMPTDTCLRKVLTTQEYLRLFFKNFNTTIEVNLNDDTVINDNLKNEIEFLTKTMEYNNKNNYKNEANEVE